MSNGRAFSLISNRIVVARYRMHLESRSLAANTIYQHLAVMRRLAHEAADSGLLSPDPAAGISRVKGVKQLGQRSGNWLTLEQGSDVLNHAYGDARRAKRDHAMLAMLLGCGLRRSELTGLEMDEIQTRQGHWAIVDLIGKGGHVRTVPIPQWVKHALDVWTSAAGVKNNKIPEENSHAYGGTPTDLQRVNGGYTNYAAWDQTQSMMLVTQIWELGNTLEFITTGKSPTAEQGAKDLVDCYFGKGTSASMSR